MARYSDFLQLCSLRVIECARISMILEERILCIPLLTVRTSIHFDLIGYPSARAYGVNVEDNRVLCRWQNECECIVVPSERSDTILSLCLSVQTEVLGSINTLAIVDSGKGY